MATGLYLLLAPRLKRSMSWSNAKADGDNVGTEARLSVRRRVREGDLERLASSMEKSSAAAFLEFYIASGDCCALRDIQEVRITKNKKTRKTRRANEDEKR